MASLSFRHNWVREKCDSTFWFFIVNNKFYRNNVYLYVSRMDRFILGNGKRIKHI